MRGICIQLVLILAALIVDAQEAGTPTNRFAIKDPQERTQVTCKAAYYVTHSDGSLVAAETAARIADFEASGILFTVVSPPALDRQVIAFHFDFPKKWDRLYKPDVLYTGRAQDGILH